MFCRKRMNSLFGTTIRGKVCVLPPDRLPQRAIYSSRVVLSLRYRRQESRNVPDSSTTVQYHGGVTYHGTLKWAGPGKQSRTHMLSAASPPIYSTPNLRSSCCSYNELNGLFRLERLISLQVPQHHAYTEHSILEYMSQT